MSKTLHYRACHLCEAICGLAIETESDEGGVPRIRSIKGDPQDSFSRGHVCPKAVALQDIQDDPDRLRQPLRRVGSEWQPIGWDEAFALVASRLGEIRERHGNDAVAVYQGNPSVHNYGLMTHSNYFLGLLKTRNRFSATSVDQLPHHLVSQQMYGHGLLIPIPDIDHTDFMLVLGGNPLASNGSIMTVPDVEKRLKALKARGGRLVVVDPRRSGPRLSPTGTCSFVPARMRRCCSGYSAPCSRRTSVAPRRCRSTGWSGCARRSRSSTPSP